MGSHSRRIVGGLLTVLVGGGLLLGTSPPSTSVDAPAPSGRADAAELIGMSNVPELSDFYDVTDYEPGEVGSLVRAEEIADPPTGTRLFRILYRSTDLTGASLPVTALFAFPDGPAPDSGYPLVSFAHGTTGVGQRCGMSQAPLDYSTPGSGAWDSHIEPMVRQGWAVVASDYSGMGAPGPASYLVGPLEARGVLDAMRAVVEPDPQTGSVPIDSGRLGVYGKSQGGEAALSALELAPTYAPELEIAGGVSLAPGFAPALQGALDMVTSNPTSTEQNMFVLMIAKSYADNYPQHTSLDTILTEKGLERVQLLEDNCAGQLMDLASDVPLGDLVKTPVDSGLVTALAEGSPGWGPLDAPVMVVQGLEDTTILPQFTHAQVAARCLLGDTVLYVRYPDDDHYTINYRARTFDPSVLDWMEARWRGEPAPSTCANQLLGSLGSAPEVGAR